MGFWDIFKAEFMDNMFNIYLIIIVALLWWAVITAILKINKEKDDE